MTPDPKCAGQCPQNIALICSPSWSLRHILGAIGQVSRMQVFDTLLLILYAQPTSGWIKPSSDSPTQTFGQMVNLNYDNHPFHQRDPSIQEPVY